MAGLINELVETLDKQGDFYKELVDFADEKLDIIIKNDIAALQKITDSENIVIGKINRLEKKRIELFNDIAFVLNKEVKDITIPNLINILDGQDEAEQVKRVGQKIKENIENLKIKNEKNKVLIKKSIEQTEYSVNVIMNSVSTPYYDARGNEIPSNIRFFDAKQ